MVKGESNRKFSGAPLPDPVKSDNEAAVISWIRNQAVKGEATGRLRPDPAREDELLAAPDLRPTQHGQDHAELSHNPILLPSKYPRGTATAAAPIPSAIRREVMVCFTPRRNFMILNERTGCLRMNVAFGFPAYPIALTTAPNTVLPPA